MIELKIEVKEVTVTKRLSKKKADLQTAGFAVDPYYPGMTHVLEESLLEVLAGARKIRSLQAVG